MIYWYISFAKSKADGGFQGATVVEAANAANALTVATLRGLNPGGEAAILEVPEDKEREPDVLPMRNKLLTKEQMLQAEAKRLGDLPTNMQNLFENMSSFVCERCNQAGCYRCD